MAGEPQTEPLANRSKPLPLGWECTRVETVGVVTLGRQRSPKDHEGPHMRPYLRVANVHEDRIDLTDVKSMNFSPDEFVKFQLRHGDILLNEGQSKELVGRAAIFRDEVPNVCFQNTLVRFRCSPVLRPAYALTIFRCYLHTGEFRRVAQWTTNIAHLGAQRFAEMDFPLPPIAEQERIVAAIESYFTRLDDAVATLSRVERNLKRYRASVLKSAVEGRLVPTEAALAKQEGRDYEPASVLLERILTERRRRWTESGKKGKYEEPAPPDTTGLPALPEGWCWTTVEQIGRIESGQTPNGIVDALVAEGDIPWFRVGDMNTSGNEKFMTQCGSWLKTVDAEQMKIHVRPVGTIIFPKRGGAIATNKKRRLKYPSAYDLNTMGVVPDESVAEYLWLWFAQVDLATLSDGSNVPQINNSDISPLCVPVPPIAEQKRIITAVDDLVSVADAARSTVDLSHTRAVRLRQAILKWAFEGKLADQDPSDEPASVLLERIKAERDLPKSAKKKSRACATTPEELSRSCGATVTSCATMDSAIRTIWSSLRFCCS